MVAVNAKMDWQDMVDEGLKPTLEDFDRLNCLALRLECGDETTAVNFPRIGWAGDVPFYQPTVAAYMWFIQYAMRATSDNETQNTFWYFALAHARDPGFFDGLKTPDAIAEKVGEWAERLPVTREEVSRACGYATNGFDDAEGGENPDKKSVVHRKSIDVAAQYLSRLDKLLCEVCALSGIPFDEAIKQTPSAIDRMISAVHVEAGKEMKLNVAKLAADYKFALYEIRKRLEAERKANG